MNNLTDYIFYFNEQQNKWYAAKREDYFLLFNDIKSPKLRSDKNVLALIHSIKKAR